MAKKPRDGASASYSEPEAAARARKAIEKAEKLCAKNDELKATLKRIKQDLRRTRAEARRHSIRLNPHLKLNPHPASKGQS